MVDIMSLFYLYIIYVMVMGTMVVGFKYISTSKSIGRDDILSTLRGRFDGGIRNNKGLIEEEDRVGRQCLILVYDFQSRIYERS